LIHIGELQFQRFYLLKIEIGISTEEKEATTPPDVPENDLLADWQRPAAISTVVSSNKSKLEWKEKKNGAITSLCCASSESCDLNLFIS